MNYCLLILLISYLNIHATIISAEESAPSNDDLGHEDESGEIINPCESVICESGQECIPNMKTREGVCECVEVCEYESEPRRMVCTNYNETFNSRCEVDRMRCWCKEGHSSCRDERYEHLHIAYFGECRDIPKCRQSELIDFPRRMREWLYNVMSELADRNEISNYYQQLKSDAQEDEDKQPEVAAVWKWCDLDKYPHDNSVSIHELFPIRAPLLTLEHCIGDFLADCDADDDHFITMKEWAKCLEIKVEDFQIKCEEINN